MLTIDGDTVCEGDYMFKKEIYLSIFYCLYFVEDITENMVYEKVMEYTYTYLKGVG